MQFLAQFPQPVHPLAQAVQEGELMVGSRIFSTRPGNPAPVPTSMTFRPPRALEGRRAALSRKWRFTTLPGR